MSSTPTVSVIVPVYDPGPYLERCIDSLLAQTMPPGELELIFVDDGSTDGSGERLDRLAAEHDHVRVIHQENSGWPGKPRNVGIDGLYQYRPVLDTDHQPTDITPNQAGAGVRTRREHSVFSEPYDVRIELDRRPFFVPEDDPDVAPVAVPREPK